MLEIVIREILELELVGRTDQTGGMRRRYDRIGKLPDLTLRILERAVALYHDFNILTGSGLDLRLNVLYQRLSVLREQLDGIFGRLVGA